METGMMLWQQAWVWAVAGLVLAAFEVAITGNILIGFAIGAMCVAVLLWVGIATGWSFAALLALAAIIALGAWLVLRRVIGVRAGQIKIVDKDINDNS